MFNKMVIGSLPKNIQIASRGFSYDMREIGRLNAKLQRKFNVIKMFTDNQIFNYEQPTMTYNKETGDVIIHESTKFSKKKNRIIKNIDEVLNEKQKLYDELNLNEDGLPKEAKTLEDINSDELTDKLEKVRRKMMEEVDYDPNNFYVFTRDHMRVDVGLMIQRSPIFVRMRQNDINFLKDRQLMMNEYGCDVRGFINEFNETSKLNEDLLANNPYASRMNIDNYPTHKYVDPETKEERTYCAASKQWSLVDPYCLDRKNFHYAGEDRVYLIMKNRYTAEWEFPITKMNFGQTFFRAKMDLFQQLTDNKWRIKFFGSSPLLHTLREFTPIEHEDKQNHTLKGVRTYWFGAHHWRGEPEMLL